jgi:hypothetical protein
MSAVATKSRPRTIHKPKSTGRTHVFEGRPLFTWRLRPDEVDAKGRVVKNYGRQYIEIHAPFFFMEQWIHVEPYNHEDGSGWQRKASTQHFRKLCNEMEAGQFTPVGWTASATEWHLKNLVHLEVAEKDQPMVDLKVSEDHPLEITDGNHRFAALKLFISRALEAGDEERVRLAKNTIVSIQVFLSPEERQRDFIRLQMGKAVSRSQLKSMQLATDVLSPEKRKYVEMATDIARILNKEGGSFVEADIAFDTLTESRNVQYSSVIADNASSLATTLYGGARIAHAIGKDAAWMAERYIESYQVLLDVRDEDNHETLFHPAKKLSPPCMNGKKLGVHLLIGIGNCVAYKLHLDGKDELDPAETKLVQDAAVEVFDCRRKGASAADKREDMNDFCKAYFKATPPKLKIDSVPMGLIECTSASTWNVDVNSPKYVAWQKELKASARAAKTETDRTRPASSKPRPQTEYEPDQVMEGDDE